MKVACIIPAYNEERTIGEILRTVKNVSLVSEIIVVNDGSSDKTSKVSRDLGVLTIELKSNQGKGAALKAGFTNTDADVCLLLDADLIGLTEEHIINLLIPVVNGEADMSVGIFSKGRLATDLAQKIAPNLSGQRAIRREILLNCCGLEFARYGTEVTLNRLAYRQRLNVVNVELRDMTHIMKEEKLGLKRGFIARMKMYWDIVKCLRV